MRTVRVGGTIRRPVEDVFGVLSDPENAPKWSPNARGEADLAKTGPRRLDATRRSQDLRRTHGGERRGLHRVRAQPQNRVAQHLGTGAV